MPERSKDWMKQAQRDLESARAQLKDNFFEWACFIAQQAAEKAVKSVIQKAGGEAWGHSVTDLLQAVGERAVVPDDLLEMAKQLDKFYIPARYPNGWVSGTPGEYITEKDAQDAVGHSEKILQFCSSLLAG
jgi:HEPN domain-containing protein